MFSKLPLAVIVLLATALLVGAMGVAMAMNPTSPYAFTILDDGSQRLLFSGRDRVVTLRLRNDGYLTWSPDGSFVVSYHLYSWSGSLIAEGSRSAIEEEVGPGDSTRLQVSIKRLPSAGLYRLQWDLLQRDVTWFTDRNPDLKSWRWIVVSPTPETLLTLLIPCLMGLLATILAVVADRTGGRSATVAATVAMPVWSVISIYGKAYLLYVELPPRFSPALSWSTSCAIAIPLALLLLLPSRPRVVSALALAVAAAVVVWGQLLYFRFFADLAGTSAILASRQAGDILDSIAALAHRKDIWLLADLPLAVPAAFLYPVSASSFKRRAAFAGVVALAAAPLLFALRHVNDYSQARNLRALNNVRNYGLYGYHLLDALDLAAKSFGNRTIDDHERVEILNWFRATAYNRSPNGQWQGRAERLNLIAIQVESMQRFAVEFEVDGQSVMPNLRRLQKEALNFTAVQDQTSRGRSSAGDFIVNTSILPVTESVAYEFHANEFRGLAHMLGERGYTTLSAIPYRSRFWNRRRTHPAYGFSTNLFADDFSPGVHVGWGLNDVDFLRQMEPRIHDLPEPFYIWLTTLSVHHPYDDFPEELKFLSLGALEGTALGNYLHGMHLFDRAFGEFFTNLRDSRLGQRTVLALWSDHSSGLLRDPRWIDYFQLGETPAARFLFSRIPFFIWLPKNPQNSQEFGMAAGQVDVAPTLAALFGIRGDQTAFLGRNLLAPNIEDLVVHPRGSWIYNGLVFLAPADQANKGSCWTVEGLQPQPPATCAKFAEPAMRQLRISEQLLVYNLQSEVAAELLDGTTTTAPAR